MAVEYTRLLENRDHDSNSGCSEHEDVLAVVSLSGQPIRIILEAKVTLPGQGKGSRMDGK